MTKLLLSILSILTIMTGSAFAANGLGYWNNNVSERETVIVDAASNSIDVLNVFETEDDLRLSLTLKKKTKTKEEKAKQHLAVILLNISADLLDPLEELSSSELALLQYISNKSGPGATVGEAVAKIEDAIKTGVYLEGAKNLSEELSNR